MLTRRQARLLGLTSGEEGGADGLASPTDASAVVGDVGPSTSSTVLSTRRGGGETPTVLPSTGIVLRLSTSAALSSASSIDSNTRGRNVVVSSSSSGNNSGFPTHGSRGRIGVRQAESMLAGAQRAVEHWAAASTTAGPVVHLNSLYAKPRSDYVSTPEVTPRGSGGKAPSQPASVGAAAERRPTRLSAAQLRARWRGVLRSCTTQQTCARGGSAAAVRVSTLSPPSSSSPLPSSSPAGEGGAAALRGRHILQLATSAEEDVMAAVPAGGGGAAGGASTSSQWEQRAPRSCIASPHHHAHGATAAALETTSRRSSTFFVPPFCCDAPRPSTTQQLQQPHRRSLRRSLTSLALHRHTLANRKVLQRQLSHEIYYQVCVRAHEARMRMLFGLGDGEKKGDAAASTATGAAADAAVMAGEAAYLRSLDATRSEQEAQVLRVIASIDTALQQQLVSAYQHPTVPTKGAGEDVPLRVENLVGSAAVLGEPRSGIATPPSSTSSAGALPSSFFVAHRPAVLEALISSTTQRVEAFVDQLLPYQQEGVRWLLRLNTVEHMNGILADDMGLGKTAQTVVYLSCCKDMVEAEVQQPLALLRARHTQLCQRVLGLAATATTTASGSGGNAAHGDALPPWLTWCAAAAAEEDDRAGSMSPAAALLVEARSCGRTLQLVKEVKQWVWQLEETDEAKSGVESPSSPLSSPSPNGGDVAGDSIVENLPAPAPATVVDVVSMLSCKRRRGRPPKHLSSIMTAAAAAAAASSASQSSASCSPPSPSSSSSSPCALLTPPVSLASLSAEQTQLSTRSSHLNHRLDHGYAVFRPVLILAPLSTLPHWAGEFARFSRRGTAADAQDRFTVYVLNGPREQREDRMRAFVEHAAAREHTVTSSAARSMSLCTTPVLVIPHDMLAKPLSGPLRHIARVQWHVVVIDEAQRIKSAQSTLFKKVRQLSSISRLVLTGTPLQNNTTELFSLLHFLAPKSFTAAAGHLFEQLDGALVAASRSTTLEDRELHILLCRRVHRLLMPFILRREKSLLTSALPPLRDYAVLCPLLPFQVTQLADVRRRHAAGTLSGSPHIQYRKILLHPYTAQSFFYVDESLVQTSGKLLVLDFMMRFLQRTRHRFLIFCGWTLVLDVVETLCSMRGIPYVRLDGKTSVEQREANIQVFNRPIAGVGGEASQSGAGSPQRPTRRRRRGGSGEALHSCASGSGGVDEDRVGEALEGEEGEEEQSPAPCCFLISKVAGGVGLNLQAADTVFLLDVDYNPQRDAQALSRVYRVGQTREVRVFRLVIDHPIERRAVAIHETKENLGRAVVQAGHYNLHSSVQEREAALQDIFRAGTLSRLSQQLATDASSPNSPESLGAEAAVEAEGEGEEEIHLGYTEASTTHCCTLELGESVERDGGAAALFKTSPLQAPMALPRVLEEEEDAELLSAPKRPKTEEEEDEKLCTSTLLSGRHLLPLAPPTLQPEGQKSKPQPRRRRHISFKLDSDSAYVSKKSSSNGSIHGEGGAGAAEESAMAVSENGKLFAAESAGVNATDSAQCESSLDAAPATPVEIPPAARLLAMRSRLEEVLLRHDGERCVLQDMFRSLESSLATSK